LKQLQCDYNRIKLIILYCTRGITFFWPTLYIAPYKLRANRRRAVATVMRW